MAEGVADSAGSVIGEAAYTDRNAEPAPDPAAAPHGWTWDRGDKRWRPSKQSPRRGPRAQASHQPQDPPSGGRDPDPPWMRGSAGDDGGGDDGRIPFDQVPGQVKDDIAGLMGMVGLPILAMLQAADPYCGGALAQNYEPAVDAALPLICRSPRIVRYFSEDKADWLLWGKLALALKPVGQAVIEHHVIRTVEVVRDRETGQVTVLRVQRGSRDGDHLTPPVQPEYQYTA